MAQDIFRKTPSPVLPERAKLVGSVKSKAQELYDLIGTFESGGTAGREIALAKTKLEEAVMWAVKGITA